MEKKFVNFSHYLNFQIGKFTTYVTRQKTRIKAMENNKIRTVCIAVLPFSDFACHHQGHLPRMLVKILIVIYSQMSFDIQGYQVLNYCTQCNRS